MAPPVPTPGALYTTTLQPAGAPIFEIIKADKLIFPTSSIAVITDANLRDDRLATGTRRRRWLNLSGGVGGPMEGYNYTSWSADNPAVVLASQMTRGRTRATTGGTNVNHRVVIMANLGENASPAHIYLVYGRIFRRAFNLAPNAAAAPVARPWEFRPTDLAIELPWTLGYSMEECAETILKSLRDFFKNSLLRQAVFTRVYLLIPKTEALQPRRVLFAWQNAWDQYIDRRITICPGTTRGPRASRAELRDLTATAAVFNAYPGGAAPPGGAANRNYRVLRNRRLPN